VREMEQAMRFYPRYPPWYLYWLGVAYRFTGRYAEAIATLPDNTLLTVLGNQGGWSQVKTAEGKTGWVRLLNVRIGTPVEQPTVKQTFAQIGGVIRTGTTKTAATTGVKGLSKEEISNAQPNPQEVRRLEAFKAKPVDIEKFAAARKLAAQEVPELKP